MARVNNPLLILRCVACSAEARYIARQTIQAGSEVIAGCIAPCPRCGGRLRGVVRPAERQSAEAAEVPEVRPEVPGSG